MYSTIPFQTHFAKRKRCHNHPEKAKKFDLIVSSFRRAGLPCTDQTAFWNHVTSRITRASQFNCESVEQAAESYRPLPPKSCRGPAAERKMFIQTQMALGVSLANATVAWSHQPAVQQRKLI